MLFDQSGASVAGTERLDLCATSGAKKWGSDCTGKVSGHSSSKGRKEQVLPGVDSDNASLVR